MDLVYINAIHYLTSQFNYTMLCRCSQRQRCSLGQWLLCLFMFSTWVIYCILSIYHLAIHCIIWSINRRRSKLIVTALLIAIFLCLFLKGGSCFYSIISMHKYLQRLMPGFMDVHMHVHVYHWRLQIIGYVLHVLNS